MVQSITVKYSAVHPSTRSTVQCNTVQYTLYSTVQCTPLQPSPVQVTNLPPAVQFPTHRDDRRIPGAGAGSGSELEGRVVLVSGGQVLGMGVYWRAWYSAGQWRAAAWSRC